VVSFSLALLYFDAIQGGKARMESFSTAVLLDQGLSIPGKGIGDDVT